MFSLLLGFYLGFNYFTVDLSDKFADDSALFERKLEGTLDGVFVSGVRVSKLHVQGSQPCL